MRPALRLAVVLAFTPFALQPVRLAAQPADTTQGKPTPLFSRGDAYLAGVFAAGTMALYPADRFFADYTQRKWLQRNRWLRGTAFFVRNTAVPGAMIIGTSLYLGGRVSGNKRMADLGLHGTEALVVGSLTSGVIKMTVGRQRPWVNDTTPHNFQLLRGLKGEKFQSFPSGHTTAAFAAAAAVTSETHRWWPKSLWVIGPMMYGGATLTGISRMYDNRHWASDVIVGAAIGTFAGQKIVHYHHSHPGNTVDRWLLQASLVPNTAGGHSWQFAIRPARPLQ